jgi:predicted glycosyltransferase
MRVLVFTNTPAHVHLYKHAVERLQQQGHEVRILAREYGCTTALLEFHDLPYTVYGYCDTSKGSLLRNLPAHYARIVPRTLRYDPDVIFGMGGYAAHAGFVSRTPVVLILDSEPTSLDHAVSRPFADAMLTPATFRKHLGSKHYVFQGFKESAYLHPDVYTPRPGIRDGLGLEPGDRYAIVRFNAFGSHHDVGVAGFTPERRRELITELAAHATVFVSDESGEMDLSSLPARPFELHPALLHDALAQADLLVADTQTMVTEAALLGTPAIRSNSFVGENDMGNFVDLERAGLVANLREFDAVLDRARELLADESATEEWRRRRDEYLRGTVNLTEVIVDLASGVETPAAVRGVSRYDARRRLSVASSSASP